MTRRWTPPRQPLETVSFPVEGMTCASCVNRITRYLRSVDGVERGGRQPRHGVGHGRVRSRPRRTGRSSPPPWRRPGTSPASTALGADERPPSRRWPTSGPSGTRRPRGTPRRPPPPAHRRDGPDDPAPRRPGAHDGRALAARVPLEPARSSSRSRRRSSSGPAAPFYRGASSALRHRQRDMNTLIAVGTSAAYGYSVAAIAFPEFFLAAGHGRRTASAAPLLRHLGRDHHAHPPRPLLEARARSHTSDAIRATHRPRPADGARAPGRGRARRARSRPCSRATSSASDPARRSPVDGRRHRRPLGVDESMVTGESMPVGKGPGDEVVGGTLATTGTLLVRATRVGARHGARPDHPPRAEAQGSRAPIQRLADVVTGRFVPARPRRSRR